MVKVLLEMGGDVEKRDFVRPSISPNPQAGRTPIYYAIRENNLEIVKILLFYRASPWSTNKFSIVEMVRGNPEMKKLIKDGRRVRQQASLTLI